MMIFHRSREKKDEAGRSSSVEGRNYAALGLSTAAAAGDIYVALGVHNVPIYI